METIRKKQQQQQKNNSKSIQLEFCGNQICYQKANTICYDTMFRRPESFLEVFFFRDIDNKSFS